MRILVIRFSSLGDVVLTTAPLQALHSLHPEAEIVFATKREYAPLLENFPNWVTVVPLESGQSVGAYQRMLGSEPFDTIIDLHGSLRSRLLTSGLKSKQIRRVEKQSIRRFGMVWSKKGLDSPISVIDSYMAAVGSARRVAPMLVLNDREQLFVAERIKGSPNRIGIGWGAKHPTKSVPSELWTRILLSAIRDTAPRVAVFGLASDRAGIERFVGESAVSLPGVTVESHIGLPQRETISQIAATAVFVSSDSGLMHAADALGVPTLGLFGPTHPSLGFAPAGPESIAFHAGSWCSPCHRHGSAPCFRERRFCFDELNVESIAAAVAAILQKHERVSHLR